MTGSNTPPAAGSGARPSQSDEPRPSFGKRLAIIAVLAAVSWLVVCALAVFALSAGVAGWGQ